MSTFFEEKIADLNSMYEEFGYPSFTWNGATYKFIPNCFEVKRELGDGGFVKDLMLKATVSRYNQYGQPIFPNDVIPSPQNGIQGTLQYNGNTFRIDAVVLDDVFNHKNGVQTSNNGATFMIVGVSITRGLAG